jgi:hypothetical protein
MPAMTDNLIPYWGRDPMPAGHRLRTKEECIAAAGAALAQALAEQDEMTPRQAAEAAHRPGGPPVDELERRIRAQRAEADREYPTDTSPPTG